jgi:hypothetical protein
MTRSRLAALAALAAVVVAVVVIAAAGGGGRRGPPVEPFVWSSARDSGLARRAAAGEAHALYLRSPGGVVATAARVARLRPLVEAAARRGRVDPDALEALVFLESAGRPDAIAGADPAAASGLTQILAQTGQSLLGMHIDLAASRRLTRQIARATAAGHDGQLEAARRRADDRFVPAKALAATVRYLGLARRDLGRSDLALVSYHMGIGNLQSVLRAFGQGAVSYPTLFFASAPDAHPAAWRRLASFGDESSLYLWKVLAAAEVMHRWRTDRRGLERIQSLQQAAPSNALVLHPPGSAPSFRDPGALAAAYGSGALVRLPDPAPPGLRVSPALTPAQRGLRPVALRVLELMAARVRKLSRAPGPLIVLSTLAADPTGWSFVLARRYSGPAQAAALQFTLDRLQALNAIAWSRAGRSLRVTVAAKVPGL